MRAKGSNIPVFSQAQDFGASWLDSELIAVAVNKLLLPRKHRVLRRLSSYLPVPSSRFYHSPSSSALSPFPPPPPFLFATVPFFNHFFPLFRQSSRRHAIHLIILLIRLITFSTGAMISNDPKHFFFSFFFIRLRELFQQAKFIYMFLLTAT